MKYFGFFVVKKHNIWYYLFVCVGLFWDLPDVHRGIGR